MTDDASNLQIIEVIPYSVFCSQNGRNGPWRLYIDCWSWRSADGDIFDRFVRVFGEMSKEDAEAYKERIEIDTVIRLRVSKKQDHRAEFVDFLGTITDESHPFVQFLTASLVPKIHQDERFGPLTWDRIYKKYDGQTLWDKTSVKLSLDMGYDRDIAPALQMANALWDQEETLVQEIKKVLIDEQLDHYNHGWRQEGDEELSADEFLAEIQLESVVINSSGRFTIWYNDGEKHLFSWHWIEIRGTLTDGITEVGLAG